ncbi:MAG TPA: hypothetical protein VMF63_07535 [Opitutaceae bacterium]|nr:hypothetical protein [Opitutaceae bacterium]
MKFPARALLVLSLVGLPLAAQTTTTATEDQTDTSAAPPQLYGQLTGDLYTAPSGTYQIPVPVLPQLGGTVSDTANTVTFDDDFTTHISIFAFPLSRELKWEYDTRGTKDFLAWFFTNIVMADFAKRFPGASMEDNGLFLPKYQDGSLLVYMLLPGGSYFANQAMILPPPKPLVAKRGNILFVKYGMIFVVSTELTERVTEHLIFNKTPAEEDQILRQRLTAIVDKMRFIKPATEAKD